MILQTLLELTASVLLIVGFIYEDKVVGFIYEDKVVAFEKWLAESFREYRAQKEVRR